MSRVQYYLDRLEQYAPLQCLHDGDCSYTYAELLDEIKGWQARLNEWKIKPGNVVGIRSDYSIAAIALLFALFARRSVAVLIPGSGDVTEHLSAACAGAFIDLSSGSDRQMQYRQGSAHRLLEQLRATGDGALVIFTSGSTGHPKAALHSAERFLRKYQKPPRRFRTLALPLFDHMAGLDTLLYTFASGGSLVITRRRDPHSILALIESAAVEVLPASPSFLRLLCTAGYAREHNLSSLRVITYGAELMDPTTLAWLNSQFPHIQIVQKYGTTEMGSPKSYSRGNDSLWLQIREDSIELKVVDRILWIRSESAMLGYLNAPAPTNDDGWYCTGDIVELDGEWIRFCGRAADVINVGGEKVSPAEVERSILELDFVQDVAVSGQPHALMGQVVKARVVLAGQSIRDEEAALRIRHHCRQRLARYKVPVKIDFSDELIVTARQKVKRI